MQPHRPIYLDHASTTPLSPVARAVYETASDQIGNASSIHSFGRAARRHVDEARELVASAIGAHPSEVVFTSGGTESDNIAMKGMWWAAQAQQPHRRRIVASAIEHHAVLDPAQWLADTYDAPMSILPVDRWGVVDQPAYLAELDVYGAETAVASVMWANNEMGSIQPITEIVAAADRHRVPVHSDAVQALGQVPINFAESGLTAMTITGHKIGGPVGTGALIVRRDAAITPVSHGGGQERGIRSGTLDTVGIRAFAAVVDAATSHWAQRAHHLTALRDRLIEGIQSAIPDAMLMGPSGHDRLPSNVHFVFPGADSDALLFLADQVGLAVSAGSACQAGVQGISHVLTAMGVSETAARGALRISVGMTTTPQDVDTAITLLPGVVAQARHVGSHRMPTPHGGE